MDFQRYINQKKEFYNLLIAYIQGDDEINFNSLVKFIEKCEYHKNKNDLKETLRLISKISKNHHRSPNFFIKIEKLLLLLRNDIKQTLSNNELYQIFKKSPKILLFLFEKKILIPDEDIINNLNNEQYRYYFYHEIQSFSSEKVADIEKVPITSPDYENHRHIGENDSYICHLIRNDLVEKFIVFVNRINLSLSSKIAKSIYETNSFLLKQKEISLIEYAAFFGSLQIFQYLKFNRVKLESSLWLFSIHSNNAELFHLLEENEVNINNNTMEQCLKESIKCHHNGFANYIINNFLDEKKQQQIVVFSPKINFNENILSYCFHYYNFSFLPTEFKNKFILFYLIQYDHLSICYAFKDKKEFDLNIRLILILIFD